MVGYSPLDQVQLTNTEHAFAGAISGAITRCISQPLDVLKIRFQVRLNNQRYVGPGNHCSCMNS